MRLDAIRERCKGVHCVDLGESFQTHIFLQNLASIQPRTSPVKFARSSAAIAASPAASPASRGKARGERPRRGRPRRSEELGSQGPVRKGRSIGGSPLAAASLGRANLAGLVLGCIEAKFCKKICVGKLSPRFTQCTPLHRSLSSNFCSELQILKSFFFLQFWQI